jgi:uncharacterized cupin superfamily protein
MVCHPDTTGEHMPKLFKPETMEFESGPFNKPPFSLLTMVPNLSRQVEAKNLVFDMRQLAPDTYSFPYHYHRNAEELMMIMSGEMTMRSADGFQVVKQGEVIFCEMGENGAHQFYNHTDKPCTYLDVKTYLGLDAVVYPDSGKIMISRYNEVFKDVDRVDYFTGEDTIGEKWEKLFAGKK